MSLKARFTNAVAVAAISLAAITAQPAPARADNDDLARFIAGAVALGLIGAAINNSNSHAAPAPIYQPPRPIYQPPRPIYQPPYYHPPRPQPPRPPVVQPHYLPSACAVRLDYSRSGTVYPESCLRRYGFYYQLPAVCARDVNTNGIRGRVYGQACLKGAGFQS